MRIVLGALLLVACGGEGPDTQPWLLDGSVAGDGGGQQGLHVSWDADPALPAQIEDIITLTSATFQVKRLQVIGDAGAGPSTTRTDFEAAFTERGELPPHVVFPGAPAGLYSKVRLDLDANEHPAYELTGTVRIGETVEPFRISSKDDLTIEIDGYSVALPPGQEATIPIELDLRDTLADIDYSALPVRDGERVLDDADPQRATVRDNVRDAFERGGP